MTSARAARGIQVLNRTSPEEALRAKHFMCLTKKLCPKELDGKVYHHSQCTQIKNTEALDDFRDTSPPVSAEENEGKAA